MFRAIPSTAAVLAACVALAGCGGDDDEGASKDDFIKEANAICADGDRKAEQIVRDQFEDINDPQPEEAQAAIAALLPIGRDIQLRIERLEKPEGDEDEIQRYLDATDRALDQLADASRDPQKSLEVLQAGDEGPSEEADRLAADYGLTECAD